VFPVLGSEFQYLTDRERHRLLEVVVGAASGALPVVAGVAASSEAGAVEHARHAAGAGADAVIALPPFLGAGGTEEIAGYYRAIAAAAGRPVFIQHTFAGMGVELINRLLDEVDEVQYVKEEMEPSAHQISALLARVSGNCRGVFGGGHGRWMLSELRRGATGFMPATEMTDLHRRIWDAWQEGDEPGARRLFNLLLPLINLIQLLGLRVCKELLVRRGVFATSALRMPGAPRLDAEDRRELEQILAAIEPHLRIPLA
jgi:4-hydroxy-tetrahydrodipicolinate synthase